MSRKSYIIECISCGVLEEVSRSDAVCCSSGCRVRLKRHPELRGRFTVTGVNDAIPLTFQLQMNAYILLFPERKQEIRAGMLDLSHPTRRDIIADDACEEACQEFSRLVARLVDEATARGAYV